MEASGHVGDSEVMDRTTVGMDIGGDKVSEEAIEVVSATESVTILQEEVSVSLDAPFIFQALYMAVGLLGMSGNMMVIVVILSSRKLRQTTTNKFIVNQSMLDFSASFFIAFTAFFREAPDIPPGILQELFCRLWLTNWPLWGIFVSSTYNLVSLTFERYFAILYPFKHSQSFTNCKAFIIMGMVWLIGPGYLAAYGVSSSTVKDGTCTVYSEWPNKRTQTAVGILTVFLQYIIPLFSITFAYIRIFITLRKSSKETSSGSSVNDKREERMNKAKKNVIKTLVQLFVCFVFCWSWNQLFFALFNFGVAVDFNSNFYHFTVLCVFTNSCMNPIVYSLNYDQFKQRQMALFCYCCLKDEDSSHSGSSVNDTWRSDLDSECTAQGKGREVINSANPTTSEKNTKTEPPEGPNKTIQIIGQKAGEASAAGTTVGVAGHVSASTRL